MAWASHVGLLFLFGGTPAWTTAWTFAAGVAAAAIGAVVAYVRKQRRDLFRARLAQVNDQLRDFYGPLLALAEANARTWEAFKHSHNPRSARFWDEPSQRDLEAWHRWMGVVFMPNNLKMVDIITTRADLIIEESMPACLVDVCAHILALKAVLGDLQPGQAPDISIVPRYEEVELLKYLRASFADIKKEQVSLLRSLRERPRLALTAGTRGPVRLIGPADAEPPPQLEPPGGSPAVESEQGGQVSNTRQ